MAHRIRFAKTDWQHWTIRKEWRLGWKVFIAIHPTDLRPFFAGGIFASSDHGPAEEIAAGRPAARKSDTNGGMCLNMHGYAR